MTSTGGSSSRPSTQTTTMPTTAPIAMPTTVTKTRFSPASASEKAPVMAAPERDRVGGQRGGVVDEALALEDHDEAARQAEPLGDRRGRHRIRRRDDGAEHECASPADPRRERLRHPADGQRRGRDETHRQQADGEQVLPQVAERREVGGAHEDRRQEDEEDELRRQRDVRQAGHEAEHKPADDHEHRVRDVETLRQGREERDRSQHRQERGEADGGVRGLHARQPT